MPPAQRDETPLAGEVAIPFGFRKGETADREQNIRTDPNLRRDLLHHAIGRAVRDHRRRQELSKQELATTAGVSIGMLSRIENATVSPSLQTLRALAAALAMPLSGFFESYDENPGVLFSKGPPDGNQNFATFCQSERAHAAEAMLVELADPLDEFFTLPQKGVRFIYALEGGFTCRLGRRRFRLTPGDSLTCTSEVHQKIVGATTLPIRFLMVTFHPQSPVRAHPTSAFDLSFSANRRGDRLSKL
jgi:transcriptional regulator with XRE-family HTH domain